MIPRWTSFIAVVACIAAPAFATDFIVTPGQSIQAAISAAQNGDRVLVQPGTYLEQINFKGKDIQVIGVGGALVTTIDSTGLSGSTVRCANQEPPTARLDGFTITGGSNFGVYVSEAFQPNPFSYTPPSNTTIERCIIRNNVTANFGGGAHLSNTSHMRNCIVEWNTAFAGGGVWGGVLEDVVIRNNNASTKGGGVYQPFLMQRCRVYENTADAGGGVAIDNGGSVEDCTIFNNFAQTGGGISAELFGTGVSASVVRTRVELNSAAVVGGCLAANLVAINTPFGTSHAMLELHANVFRMNDSANGTMPDLSIVLDGGMDENASVYLTRSVIDGDAIDATGFGVVSVVGIEGCVFVNEPNPGAIGLGATYCLLPTPGLGIGNFAANPSFVDPANGDVHLMPGSPCIDKYVPMAFSQFDFDGDFGAGAAGDVGADERVSRLYVHGNPTPGGGFELKTAGTPGDAVLVFFSASLAPAPIPTIYGNFGLGLPILFGAPISVGAIQANGVADLVGVIPSFAPPFTTIYAQAIAVGPSGAQFTNTAAIVIE